MLPPMSRLSRVVAMIDCGLIVTVASEVVDCFESAVAEPEIRIMEADKPSVRQVFASLFLDGAVVWLVLFFMTLN